MFSMLRCTYELSGSLYPAMRRNKIGSEIKREFLSAVVCDNFSDMIQMLIRPNMVNLIRLSWRILMSYTWTWKNGNVERKKLFVRSSYGVARLSLSRWRFRPMHATQCIYFTCSYSLCYSYTSVHIFLIFFVRFDVR